MSQETRETVQGLREAVDRATENSQRQDERVAVIGQTQQRVDLAAAIIGAETLPTEVESLESEQAKIDFNRDCIEQLKRDRALIIDIGPDDDKDFPGKYYTKELDWVKGYDRLITVPFPGSRNLRDLYDYYGRLRAALSERTNPGAQQFEHDSEMGRKSSTREPPGRY